MSYSWLYAADRLKIILLSQTETVRRTMPSPSVTVQKNFFFVNFLTSCYDFDGKDLSTVIAAHYALPNLPQLNIQSLLACK